MAYRLLVIHMFCSLNLILLECIVITIRDSYQLGAPLSILLELLIKFLGGTVSLIIELFVPYLQNLCLNLVPLT